MNANVKFSKANSLTDGCSFLKLIRKQNLNRMHVKKTSRKFQFSEKQQQQKFRLEQR